MAITQQSQGDQALTLNTPVALATITTAGVYQLRLYCNALAADDILFVRVKEIYQTTGQGGVEATTLNEPIFGTTLAEKNVETVPWVCLNSLKFEIEQTAGTGRTIPWEVVQLQ